MAGAETTRPGQGLDADLYRRIDAMLAERADAFPRRPEPLFSELVAAIGELARRLRERAGVAEPQVPPPDLVAAAVFVVGYYRSGTTLLLGLLGGHPDVVVLPGESNHFVGARARFAAAPPADRVALMHEHWLRRLVMPDGLPPFWRLGRPWEGAPDRYEAFTRAFLAYAAGTPAADSLGLAAAAVARAAESKPRIWIEKTPQHTFHVPEIAHAYPDARFVHIVRDPRATLASIELYNRGRYFQRRGVAAAEIAESLELARSNPVLLGEERYAVVRYEELVSSPRSEMERLAAFLDLPWSDALLRPAAVANSSAPERRVDGEIHTQSLTYGGDLRPSSRIVVSAFAGRAAADLGYATPAGSRAVELAVRAWLRLTHRAHYRWHTRALARSRPS